MEIDNEAVLRTFVAESLELLASMEESLVALEADPGDEERLLAIFRAAHTIKGNAFALGFERVADFAHALEDLLERVRRGDAAVTADLVTLLLSAVDALRQLAPATVTGVDELDPDHRQVWERLTRMVTPGLDSHALAVAAAAPESSTPERRYRPLGRRRGDEQSWMERNKTIRVDLDLLDRVLDLTGEMTIARGRLRELLDRSGGVVGEQILEAQREVDRLGLDLQEQVMRIRMVPVGPTFRQFIRLVRDAAHLRGRKAVLKLSGEDVEVDNTVIEHLRDPLGHMVRNAVDHGIEPPDERTARGKDPRGCIELRARHEAGVILIELADDGAGIDRTRLVQRAEARGWDTTALGEGELLRLVFEPGLSTAESVSGLSGRGVGLDVVLRAVEALRGSIHVTSREGVGTTFAIRLPLTLAIINGFGVGVGAETYVLPMESIVECVEMPRPDCETRDGRGVIQLRGEPLPYVRLRSLFALPPLASQRENVVVVQHDGGRTGLAVDALHGGLQTVIKPMGRGLRDVPGVAGSAILGDGRVALILDVPSLLLEAQAGCGVAPAQR